MDRGDTVFKSYGTWNSALRAYLDAKRNGFISLLPRAKRDDDLLGPINRAIQ
jgi:hypothetical protein